jgi:hypothetical protein
MDEQVIKMAVEEVMDELGIGERSYRVETIMGVEDGYSAELRIFGEADGKLVIIPLRDRDGVTVYTDELKDSIRQRLRTSEQGFVP